MSWGPIKYVRGELLIVDVEMPVEVTEEAFREWYRTEWTKGKELPEDFDPEDDGEYLLDEYVDSVYYANVRGDKMGQYITGYDSRETYRERID